MRLAHKFNWHYAPPVYPDGDTQLWCQWCGFRETIFRRDRPYKVCEEPKQAARTMSWFETLQKDVGTFLDGKIEEQLREHLLEPVDSYVYGMTKWHCAKCQCTVFNAIVAHSPKS